MKPYCRTERTDLMAFEMMCTVWLETKSFQNSLSCNDYQVDEIKELYQLGDCLLPPNSLNKHLNKCMANEHCDFNWIILIMHDTANKNGRRELFGDCYL